MLHTRVESKLRTLMTIFAAETESRWNGPGEGAAKAYLHVGLTNPPCEQKELGGSRGSYTVLRKERTAFFRYRTDLCYGLGIPG